MEIAGYISALLIGVSLGMIGGGGSILTVPALVYLMNIHPLPATAYSLFIVGATSLIGGARAYRKELVDFKAVTEFGIPSIFAVFIARHYILAAIPPRLFAIGNFEITRDKFLMLVFALLMLISAVSMIYHNKTGETNMPSGEKKEKHFQLMLQGVITGIVTGVLGAGGGFLIVPALVLLIKLPMKTAIGTSLLIIAINSLFGFLFSLRQFEFDWSTLVLFTLIAVAGVFIGGNFADKIPGGRLKKYFGWFVLSMAVYILVKEILM